MQINANKRGGGRDWESEEFPAFCTKTNTFFLSKWVKTHCWRSKNGFRPTQSCHEVLGAPKLLPSPPKRQKMAQKMQ